MELTKWRRTTFTCQNVCRFTEFCRVDRESSLGADAHLCRLWIGFIWKSYIVAKRIRQEKVCMKIICSAYKIFCCSFAAGDVSLTVD